MTQESYEKALETLADLQGPEVAGQMQAQLEEISPSFARYALSVSYGTVYTREGLSLRDRQLVTLGVVAAMGGTDAQLRRHMAAALEVGLTPAELVEVVVQVNAYAGAPRGSNAIRAAADVAAERGLRLP